jgi:hypothetical protein
MKGVVNAQIVKQKGMNCSGGPAWIYATRIGDPPENINMPLARGWPKDPALQRLLSYFGT